MTYQLSIDNVKHFSAQRPIIKVINYIKQLKKNVPNLDLLSNIYKHLLSKI